MAVTEFVTAQHEAVLRLWLPGSDERRTGRRSPGEPSRSRAEHTFLPARRHGRPAGWRRSAGRRRASRRPDRRPPAGIRPRPGRRSSASAGPLSPLPALGHRRGFWALRYAGRAALPRRREDHFPRYTANTRARVSLPASCSRPAAGIRVLPETRSGSRSSLSEAAGSQRPSNQAISMPAGAPRPLKEMRAETRTPGSRRPGTAPLPSNPESRRLRAARLPHTRRAAPRRPAS